MTFQDMLPTYRPLERNGEITVRIARILALRQCPRSIRMLLEVCLPASACSLSCLNFFIHLGDDVHGGTPGALQWANSPAHHSTRSLSGSQRHAHAHNRRSIVEPDEDGGLVIYTEQPHTPTTRSTRGHPSPSENGGSPVRIVTLSPSPPLPPLSLPGGFSTFQVPQSQFDAASLHLPDRMQQPPTPTTPSSLSRSGSTSSRTRVRAGTGFNQGSALKVAEKGRRAPPPPAPSTQNPSSYFPPIFSRPTSVASQSLAHPSIEPMLLPEDTAPASISQLVYQGTGVVDLSTPAVATTPLPDQMETVKPGSARTSSWGTQMVQGIPTPSSPERMRMPSPQFAPLQPHYSGSRSGTPHSVSRHNTGMGEVVYSDNGSVRSRSPVVHAPRDRDFEDVQEHMAMPVPEPAPAPVVVSGKKIKKRRGTAETKPSSPPPPVPPILYQSPSQPPALDLGSPPKSFSNLNSVNYSHISQPGTPNVHHGVTLTDAPVPASPSFFNSKVPSPAPTFNNIPTAPSPAPSAKALSMRSTSSKLSKKRAAFNTLPTTMETPGAEHPHSYFDNPPSPAPHPSTPLDVSIPDFPASGKASMASPRLGSTNFVQNPLPGSRSTSPHPRSFQGSPNMSSFVSGLAITDDKRHSQNSEMGAKTMLALDGVSSPKHHASILGGSPRSITVAGLVSVPSPPPAEGQFWEVGGAETKAPGGWGFDDPLQKTSIPSSPAGATSGQALLGPLGSPSAPGDAVALVEGAEGAENKEEEDDEWAKKPKGKGGKGKNAPAAEAKGGKPKKGKKGK